MKAAFAIIINAAIGAWVVESLYAAFGWRYFYMPYPHLIGPVLHSYFGPQYDVAVSEIRLEFFIILLAAFSGIRWVSRKLSN